jgi:HPt (histidine-containing phosphotransfer) domain-containing protein
VRDAARTSARTSARASGDSFEVAEIDPDVVASLRRLGERSGRDVLGELTGLFLDQADNQLATARQQLADGRLNELARTAHAMKGSGSVIGARRASAAAAALEVTVRSAETAGRLDDPAITAALHRFVEELERFRGAVRPFLTPG